MVTVREHKRRAQCLQCSWAMASDANDDLVWRRSGPAGTEAQIDIADGFSFGVEREMKEDGDGRSYVTGYFTLQLDGLEGDGKDGLGADQPDVHGAGNTYFTNDYSLTIGSDLSSVREFLLS